MALKFHPDRNKESDASERFKEVNEAYQVLSDPQRKAQYAPFGHAGVNGQQGRGLMDSRDLAALETYLTPFSVVQTDKLLTEERI